MKLELHPVIRIVGFVVLAAFVATGGLPALLAAAVLLTMACLFARTWPGNSAWRMLVRLRWLFLSLLVVYLAFTPGRPLWDTFWAPTAEGLGEGLTRIGALAVLAIGAHLLMRTTPREQLLPALYWLARPLAWLGVSRERFAVRMTLVMEAVTDMRALILGRLPEKTPTGRFDGFAEAVAGAYREVLTRADGAPLEPVEINEAGAPPAHQWLLPVLMGALFVVLL